MLRLVSRLLNMQCPLMYAELHLFYLTVCTNNKELQGNSLGGLRYEFFDSEFNVSQNEF